MTTNHKKVTSGTKNNTTYLETIHNSVKELLETGKYMEVVVRIKIADGHIQSASRSILTGSNTNWIVKKR